MDKGRRHWNYSDKCNKVYGTADSVTIVELKLTYESPFKYR
jgi:hypothetical protein